MSNDVMTTTQAARFLNVCRLTILRGIWRGDYPNAMRANQRGHWRIPKTDLLRFVDKYKLIRD